VKRVNNEFFGQYSTEFILKKVIFYIPVKELKITIIRLKSTEYRKTGDIGNKHARETRISDGMQGCVLPA
jgi:hypothetical protein